MAYGYYGSDPVYYAQRQQEQQQAGMQRIFQMLMQMKMLKEQRGERDWEKQMGERTFGLREQQFQLQQEQAQREQKRFEREEKETRDKEFRLQKIRQQYPELVPVIETGFDPKVIEQTRQKTELDLRKAQADVEGIPLDQAYKQATINHINAQIEAMKRGTSAPPLAPGVVQGLGELALSSLKEVQQEMDIAQEEGNEIKFIRLYEQAKKGGYPVDKPIEYAYVTAIDPLMEQDLSKLKQQFNRKSKYSVLYNLYLNRRQAKGQPKAREGSSLLGKAASFLPPVVAGKAIAKGIRGEPKPTGGLKMQKPPEGAKFLYKDPNTGKPVYVLPDGTMIWWVEE